MSNRDDNGGWNSNQLTDSSGRRRDDRERRNRGTSNSSSGRFQWRSHGGRGNNSRHQDLSRYQRPSERYTGHSQSTVRRSSLRDPHATPVSCVDRGAIPPPSEITPTLRPGQSYPVPRYPQPAPARLRKTVCTAVNEKDVMSNVGKYFRLWPNLKPVNRPTITRWIISRHERVHQDECDVFIRTDCP